MIIVIQAWLNSSKRSGSFSELVSKTRHEDTLNASELCRKIFTSNLNNVEFK